MVDTGSARYREIFIYTRGAQNNGNTKKMRHRICLYWLHRKNMGRACNMNGGEEECI
jgi:hypothetical protein